MPEFLVELFVPRDCEVDELAENARRAAEELALEGVGVRYLRAIFVPEDETCFFLYDAASADDVAEAARRGGVPFDRVTQAVSPAAQPAAHDR